MPRIRERRLGKAAAVPVLLEAEAMEAGEEADEAREMRCCCRRTLMISKGLPMRIPAAPEM